MNPPRLAVDPARLGHELVHPAPQRPGKQLQLSSLKADGTTRNSGPPGHFTPKRFRCSTRASPATRPVFASWPRTLAYHQTVTITLDLSQRAQVAPGCGSFAGTFSRKVELPPMDSGKPRVLIVDDTPENIHVLMALLRRTCTVDAAKNGARALEYARAEVKPDLILLDVMMPDMSGYEVCQQLKADPLTAHIPVIFVTGLGNQADEKRAREMGAVDYLVKPFQAELVRARVTHHLLPKIS